MDTKQRRKSRANLRYWYNQASETEVIDGMNWYNEAQEFTQGLSEMFGLSGEVCAGVVSALSPNNKWERNKKDAVSVLSAVGSGISEDVVKVCTYNANKSKAFAIARGDREMLKRSPKTYAFARNVGEMDGNYVTIDKWHMRACITRSKTRKDVKDKPTALQYRLLQEDCLKVANEIGIKGYQLQAIVWVTIRNKWLKRPNIGQNK